MSTLADCTTPFSVDIWFDNVADPVSLILKLCFFVLRENAIFSIIPHPQNVASANDATIMVAATMNAAQSKGSRIF